MTQCLHICCTIPGVGIEALQAMHGRYTLKMLFLPATQVLLSKDMSASSSLRPVSDSKPCVMQAMAL